jgi:hypothetical protein
MNGLAISNSCIIAQNSPAVNFVNLLIKYIDQTPIKQKTVQGERLDSLLLFTGWAEF